MIPNCVVEVADMYYDNDKDIEQIKEELENYYGTAIVNGFPMAMVDYAELESKDEEKLRTLAEKLGLDR